MHAKRFIFTIFLVLLFTHKAGFFSNDGRPTSIGSFAFHTVAKPFKKGTIAKGSSRVLGVLGSIKIKSSRYYVAQVTGQLRGGKC